MSLFDGFIAFMLLTGSFWNLLAALGLQQFPDVLARMHAASKSATLGLVLVLGGAAFALPSPGDTAKLLLVIVLQFITAPVSSHMVGRATYRGGRGMAWATTVDELADAAIDAPQDHS